MVRPQEQRLRNRLSILEKDTMPPHENGVFDDIDDTPKIVGAIVLGSVAMLVLLKTAGFRFTFSANVGAK